VPSKTHFTYSQTCPCGNLTRLDPSYPKKGYLKYCSDTCSKKYRSQDQEYNKIMSNKDWLYKQRIILKKSKEKIAEELNCSTTVVNKWLKYHEIPNVKYNESNTETLLKLRDRDFLYNLHVIGKKSCDEIATLIQSSKGTVSIWLNKHGIETNNSNDYPRKRGPSLECLEIFNYIKTIYDGDVELEVSGLLGDGLSLDILIPEFSLGIEYNGLYSHIYRPHENTFAKIKGPNYHLKKTELLEKNGIQLLHIFSSSWKEKTEIWKSIISNKLKKSNYKIYARNCVIKHVETFEKNNFLDENHLQGKDKSIIKLGLYYENELVSLMTFCKPRYNKNYVWELSRFCNKKFYNIIGGFSKLLYYFKQNFIGSIITYADRTYSNGNVYNKNGFTFLRKNAPSYYYTHKNREIMINRHSMQKKELLKKLNKPELTEYELARELGFEKIFDVGEYVFVME
jgi:hypothetical protein